MPKIDDIPNFTRDPNLAADIADQFGGGDARAEQLIMANQLRYSDELNAANLLVEDIEARGEFSESDVESAVGLPEGSVTGVTKRGRYLTYTYVLGDPRDPRARHGKDALVVGSDGSLEVPESPDTPERAALKAQAAAQAQVRSAQSEADDIVAKAREEAARIIAEAAQKGEEKRATIIEDSVKAREEHDGEQPVPPVNQADSGQRTPSRPPSQASGKPAQGEGAKKPSQAKK